MAEKIFKLSQFKNLAIKVEAPVTDCSADEPDIVGPAIPLSKFKNLAIKVQGPVTDCSDIAFDDDGTPLPRVQPVSLAQKIVAPVTDCSPSSPATSTVTALRLTGELDPDESAEATRDRLLWLLRTLGEYDKALGGSGLEITATNPAVGVLAFMIVPLGLSGSSIRLQALAKVLDDAINNQTNHLNQPPSRRWTVEEVRVAA